MAPHPESSPRRPAAATHDAATLTRARQQPRLRPIVPVVPIVPVIPTIPRGPASSKAQGQAQGQVQAQAQASIPEVLARRNLQSAKPSRPATASSESVKANPETEPNVVEAGKQKSKERKAGPKGEQQAALPKSVAPGQKKNKRGEGSKSRTTAQKNEQKPLSNGMSAQAQQMQKSASRASTLDEKHPEQQTASTGSGHEIAENVETTTGKVISAPSEQKHSPLHMNGVHITANELFEKKRSDDISTAGQLANFLTGNTEVGPVHQTGEASPHNISSMTRRPISFHPPNGLSTPSSVGSAMFTQPTGQFIQDPSHQHRVSAGNIGIQFGPGAQSTPSPVAPLSQSAASLPYPPPGLPPHGFAAPPFEHPFHYLHQQPPAAEPHPGFGYPPNFGPRHDSYASEPFGLPPTYTRFGSFGAAGTPPVAHPMGPPGPPVAGLEDQTHRINNISWEDHALSSPVAERSDSGSRPGVVRDTGTPRPLSSLELKGWSEFADTGLTAHHPDHMNEPLPHINGAYRDGAPNNRAAYDHDPYPPVDDSDNVKYYLCEQFLNTEYADYWLTIHHSQNAYWNESLPIHGVIVSRNDFLSSLLSQHRHGSVASTGENKVSLAIDDSFIQPGPFKMALRYFYGGALLTSRDIILVDTRPEYANRWTMQQWSLNKPEDQMEYALSYAATGHLLQSNDIAVRGMSLASNLISWDTIELALSFALGGLNTKHSEPLSNSRHAVAGVSNNFNGASTNGLAGGAQIEANVIYNLAISHGKGQEYDSSEGGKYGNLGLGLMHKVLDFIMENFPENFEFDRHPRLTVTSEPKPNFSNPRLTTIQFGELPLEDAAKSNIPDITTKVLSRVLVLLPFFYLKRILEAPNLGRVQSWPRLHFRKRLAENIIEERERRRKSTIGAVHAMNAGDIDWTPLCYLFYKEVVLADPDGRLERPIITKEWDSPVFH